MPNLNHTSTGIQPNRLRTPRALETTEFDVAGFKVQAADLGDIRRATFEMKIPLNPGDYTVPGDFKDIELTIKDGTTATIQLAVHQMPKVKV